ERQTGLLTGRTATMAWNLDTCKTYAKQANAENASWNVTIVDPIAAIKKQTKSYINNGVAINATSKNKERAMMVLNEFYTNPEVFDLAMLGIEGKHWTAVGEDQYKIIDATNFPTDGNCNWGWTNINIKRTEFVDNRTIVDDARDALLADWNANVKAEHPYDSFNFDNTKVSTQVAAVDAIIGTYYDPLVNGLVDDVDKTIAEFKAALEKAGIQDIMNEMKSQAEAHVAAQK
ncbi:MAG: ABC transporter substrate-binding protein, partial [Lachnospiraceae bacterium]|nr:ABC transporter substrate-binding protein [Lachnospiraceae bacterium]